MSRRKAQYTQPRRVDFEVDHDRTAAVLGILGFSTRYITQRTGLTPCQVTYRLHKLEIRRADYRNGDTDVATAVVSYSRGEGGRLPVLKSIVLSDFEQRAREYLRHKKGK